jgi:HK97 family phage portal protein
MGFFDRIGRVFSSGYRFSGRGGGGSNYALRSYYQPSTRFDWAAEVGEVRQNPIVAIAIDWILKNSNSVPIKLYKRTRFGDEVEIEGHPVLDLLNRPNPYYSGYTLLQMTIADILTTGSGYWVMVNNNGGRLAEVYWMDARYVAPDFPNSGEEYMFGWKYTPAGTGVVEEYRKDQVVDFKRSFDPYNDRIGYTPLLATMKEMALVNLNSTYTAAVLKNVGVTNMVITPKGDTTILGDEATSLKKEIFNSIGLDNRGEPLVLTSPVDVSQLGMKTQDMMLQDVDANAVSRICAAIGVSPMVLGLPDQGRTYANYHEAQRAAWINSIIPMHDLITESLKNRLLNYYDPSRSMCLKFDYSDVEALADDRKVLAEEAKILYDSGICTKNEARLRVGLPEVDNGDDFKQGSATGTGTETLPEAAGFLPAGRAQD